MDINYKYYEHFMEFWLPIYRKQVDNAKYENNHEALNEIYLNIDKNWHLQEYKDYIFKKLGIKYLLPDIDSNIISIYFKNKKKKEMLYDNTRKNKLLFEKEICN